jgi:hypothetical protein
MNASLPQLKKEMDDANAIVTKLTRKLGPSVIRSEEYKKARAAYKAYWAAVDASK